MKYCPATRFREDPYPRSFYGVLNQVWRRATYGTPFHEEVFFMTIIRIIIIWPLKKYCFVYAILLDWWKKKVRVRLKWPLPFSFVLMDLWCPTRFISDTSYVNRFWWFLSALFYVVVSFLFRKVNIYLQLVSNCNINHNCSWWRLQGDA